MGIKVSDSADVVLFRELHARLSQFIGDAAERVDLTDADRHTIGEIRYIAKRATDAAGASWAEYLKSIERAWDTTAPEAVRFFDRDVSQFLARSEEVASLGSAQVPVIRFSDARAQIVAAGEKLIGQIADCIALADEREEKTRRWSGDRVRFIAELYERTETRELMGCFDTAESLLGQSCEELARPALIRVLAIFVTACARAGKPFTYRELPVDGQVPLYDFRTMREEWKATRQRA